MMKRGMKKKHTQSYADEIKQYEQAARLADNDTRPKLK